MDKGQTIDLVPAAIVKGSHPSVSGKALVVGTYMHLTETVTVEPGAYCLMILVKEKSKEKSGDH
jgi:hypothetical protein